MNTHTHTQGVLQETGDLDCAGCVGIVMKFITCLHFRSDVRMGYCSLCPRDGLLESIEYRVFRLTRRHFSELFCGFVY